MKLSSNQIQNKTAERLLSLDVFRGITIAAMILVNSPGNRTSYSFLHHAQWNGCTLADLVFPFFIFIVGVSLVFALTKNLAHGAYRSELIGKVIKRTAIIFLLGLFLNGFPHFDLEKIRILGVLQRIAICYFFAAILFLTVRIRTQAFIMMAILLGYWAVMTLIPVPELEVSNLPQENNLAAYIDRIFLKGHLFHPNYDPEGILSTFPAIATALLGNLTGAWLISYKTKEKKLVGMIVASVVALVTGWIWGYWFPINKALWTSSYVLWTGGLALALLALCYWLIEIKSWKKWSKPFEIFGINAIAAYFLHIFFLKIQSLIHLQKADGTSESLRLFITGHLFGWTTLENASLLYAVSYTLLWLFVLWILYRFKIFIRI